MGIPRIQRGAMRGLLVFADVLALTLAFFLTFYLRNYGPFRAFLTSVQPIAIYLTALPFAVALLLAIFALRGLYRPKQRISAFGELYLVSQSVTLWALIIMAGSYLVKYDYSRIIVVLFWLTTLVLLNLERSLVGKIQERLARRGIGLTNVLIVGAGKPAKLIAQQLKGYRRQGFRLAGFVGANHGQTADVIGTLAELFPLIERNSVHQVYVADPSIPYATILRLVNDCPTGDVEFKITANVFPLIGEITSLHDLEQIPSLSLKKSHPTAFSRVAKRALDLALAAFGLLLIAPLWLAVALLIRFDSLGPVLIKQRRVGLKGKEFDLYKFRTMRAESPLYAPSPLTATDPRVTRIGRWLRQTSLDELPQLLNVISGDMSIVGPRPEMPFIVAQYQDWQRKRLSVRPGLTGLWQVLGRKDLPLHEHLEYDFYYVNNQSLLLDLIIIIRTIPQIIFGRGAY